MQTGTVKWMLLLAGVVIMGLLCPQAHSETVTLSAERCCGPTANCTAPDAPNTYIPLEKRAVVGTGSRDVYIPRTILHFNIKSLGNAVTKAELRITRNSVVNNSRDRRTTDPFPADIILEHIEAGPYPHDEYGKGDYWLQIGTEWNAKALGVPGNIVLVKGGTNLKDTPITVDITRVVNDDLRSGRGITTLRVRALNSTGDGFFAYFENPTVVAQTAISTAPAK